LLNLGNARKVKDNLSGCLDTIALEKLEAEIVANAIALFHLGRNHQRFALRQSSQHWRQKVSRLYYAAYNVSRSVRLFVAGEYSTEIKDHQKYENLPDDFPRKARYVNQLAILREDRNTCDYDHLSRASDLVLGSTAATGLVNDFINDAKNYLHQRGLSV
jgi:hypothetical protein